MEKTAVEVACRHCQYWYHAGKGGWGTCTGRLNQNRSPRYRRDTFGKTSANDMCKEFRVREEKNG